MREGGSYIKEKDGTRRLVERTQPATQQPAAPAVDQPGAAATDNSEVTHEDQE